MVILVKVERSYVLVFDLHHHEKLSVTHFAVCRVPNRQRNPLYRNASSCLSVRRRAAQVDYVLTCLYTIYLTVTIVICLQTDEAKHKTVNEAKHKAGRSRPDDPERAATDTLQALVPQSNLKWIVLQSNLVEPRFQCSSRCANSGHLVQLCLQISQSDQLLIS